MPTRSIMDEAEARSLAEYLRGLKMPFTVTVTPGARRSLSQNALLHLWFGEIAAQTFETADQVKRECKYYNGCAILMADDPAFVAFVGNLSRLTVEEKIAAMDYIAVTSVMTKPQLSKMCDAVHRKYAGQGIRLTDPAEQERAA